MNRKDRIENMSDQLDIFSQYITKMTKELMKKENLTFDEAVEMMKLSTQIMRTDVLHHMAQEGIDVRLEMQNELTVDIPEEVRVYVQQD